MIHYRSLFEELVASRKQCRRSRVIAAARARTLERQLRAKSMKRARRPSGQPDVDVVAHVEPLESALQSSSIGAGRAAPRAFEDAPVTIASNDSPILPTGAARPPISAQSFDFVASSSRSVQCAQVPRAQGWHRQRRSRNAAFTSRCVSRSGNRRFGAVECV